MSKVEIFKIGVKRIQKVFSSTFTIKKIISIQLHEKIFSEIILNILKFKCIRYNNNNSSNYQF